MMDDLNRFAEDENSAAPTDSQLKSIDELVNRAQELAAHIATMEDALSAAEKEYRELTEHELVERLTAAGTSHFTTTGGLSVTIKSDIAVTEIKDYEKKRALAEKRASWLESNGGESLIQESVEMVFDKGSHERAIRVMNLLQEAGFDFAHGSNINTASFKAFVRDIMQEGDVPLADLGLYSKTWAQIKAATERKSKRR